MDNPVLWALIGLQVVMGAFDTLFHHEGTERLAWRPSQRQELRLHGVRNFFYMIIFIFIFIFICFAWTEPRGVFTMILATILVVEVLITLWDFVEEDLTRRLPATERVTHTLLALNYGAILALAAPHLIAWAQMDSAIIPTHYGWWSIFATLSAVGVGLFSARDLLAANRSDRLARPDPALLLPDLPAGQRVLITGGTGFIGTRLVAALVAGGHDVTVLTRRKDSADHLAHPIRSITDLRQIPDTAQFDSIINLAGDAVAGGLWTKAKRGRIIGSRVDVTEQIIALIDRLHLKPQSLINGSAIGWYGLRDDTMLDETAASTDCFTHHVCAAWEKAADAASDRGLRVVKLRIGLVLGVEGGMLGKLLTPFEFGLGGRMGDGRQWMSWIDLDDMVRLIGFVMAHDIDGPINATAPNPVTNADLTIALANALGRPAWLRFPGWLLRFALGDLAHETMLSGQRIIPAKAQDAGFTFWHSDLNSALRKMTGARATDIRALRRRLS
ncbi:TIGR01777 family oxidoreductase [Yoonia sp. 2307UL14-13]|uniref:TIGR01777 family oxidoreductase n=1 Tax=Yoonia sp. 2307UL14-13 TaxID=3126506 RepID=UPI0030A0265A